MAFLLDVDGTLLDFASTPMDVVIPPELPGTLRALKQRVNGALAMISGRPVEQVAALFGDVPQAIAGEHGGAVRHAPDGAIQRPALTQIPPDWLTAAERLAQAHPGTLLERKARGFVLHFRRTPAAGPQLGQTLAALVAGSSDFALVPAHMAWEVRPNDIDKGVGVKTVMARPPFAGRLPVFMGDDVTDEDAIDVVQAMGGIGMMVADTFGDPAGVRAWLAQLAARGW